MPKYSAESSTTVRTKKRVAQLYNTHDTVTPQLVAKELAISIDEAEDILDKLEQYIIVESIHSQVHDPKWSGESIRGDDLFILGRQYEDEVLLRVNDGEETYTFDAELPEYPEWNDVAYYLPEWVDLQDVGGRISDRHMELRLNPQLPEDEIRDVIENGPDGRVTSRDFGLEFPLDGSTYEITFVLWSSYRGDIDEMDELMLRYLDGDLSQDEAEKKMDELHMEYIDETAPDLDLEF